MCGHLDVYLVQTEFVNKALGWHLWGSGFSADWKQRQLLYLQSVVSKKQRVHEVFCFQDMRLCPASRQLSTPICLFDQLVKQV